MLRLTLVIVLVAATISAKHVKEVKRIHEDIRESCYDEKTHPFYSCHPRDCTYPTLLALGRAGRPKDIKRVLLHGDNLEKLCSEAREIIPCVISAYDTISAECQEQYEKTDHFTQSLYDNGAAFLEIVCNDDVFESIRTNMDCIMEEDLVEDVNKCQYLNKDRNCSGFDYSDDPDASNDCYREKYRKNCNVDQVISCSSKKVTAACSEDAGDLIELLQGAFFKTIKAYYCPNQAGGKEFKNLLKYFRK